MVSRSGLLLAFEGLDGSGKSTQVQLCAEWLAGRASRPARGGAPLVLREPGGTPLGESIRSLLLGERSMGALSEMLLYQAARAELYEHVVLPALRRGETVLLDRSHYSTWAYQGAGLGVDRALLEQLTLVVTRGRLPDKVVLLEVPPEQAVARLALRSDGAPGDRIEQRDPDFFARVAEGYRQLAQAHGGRFLVVSGTGSPEQVASAVREALAHVV
jgi:dTMP kinase